MGDEGQGHSSAERGGEHDRHGDCHAGEIERGIGRVGSAERLHDPLHRVHRGVVEHQRTQRQQSHHDLDRRQRESRVGERVDIALDAKAAKRQTQNECAKHDFKCMRGTAEHHAQHAYPDDLVNERRAAGQESHNQQLSPCIASKRHRCHDHHRWRYRTRWQRPANQPDCNRNDNINDARRQDGAWQADRSNQYETTQQNADGGTETVGEIQRRKHRT